MADPGVTTGTERRHDRTESACFDDFVDWAFPFVITPRIISDADRPRGVPALQRTRRGIPAFRDGCVQLAWFRHAHMRCRDSDRLADRRSLPSLLVSFALIFLFPWHLTYAGLANGLGDGHRSLHLTVSTLPRTGVVASCRRKHLEARNPT